MDRCSLHIMGCAFGQEKNAALALRALCRGAVTIQTLIDSFGEN